MKGKIEFGFLYIEREGSEMKSQYCPFDSTPAVFEGEDKARCGVWCPLFGEPKTEDQEPPTLYRGVSVSSGPQITSLSLCQKTLYFDDFEDERNEKDSGASA